MAEEVQVVKHGRKFVGSRKGVSSITGIVSPADSRPKKTQTDSS